MTDMQGDVKRSPHNGKEGSWHEGPDWSLCGARSQVEAKASGAGGCGTAGQGRALRRCHSDDYIAGGNAAPTSPRWRRVRTGSGEIWSDIWCVWVGTRGGIMAPDGCNSYDNMGAPIMLLSRARLEMSG